MSEDELDRAVAKLTHETSQRIRTLTDGGLPRELALSWGQEPIKLQDQLLKHSYLPMATRLVSFDPGYALRE